MTKPIVCPNCGHDLSWHNSQGCYFGDIYQICQCSLTPAQIRKFFIIDEIALALDCAKTLNSQKQHWGVSSPFQKKIDKLLRIAGRIGGRRRIYWTQDNLQSLADIMTGRKNAKTQKEICEFRTMAILSFPRIRKQLARYWTVKSERLGEYHNAPSVYWIEK